MSRMVYREDPDATGEGGTAEEGEVVIAEPAEVPADTGAGEGEYPPE
jgi:hypothetical protein